MGLVLKVIVPFLIGTILCGVANAIPMWSYNCPSITGLLSDWKKEYIDKPIYKEQMKYFSFYYHRQVNMMRKVE